MNLFACVQSTRYAKLAELKNDKSHKVMSDQMEADNIADDMVVYIYFV